MFSWLLLGLFLPLTVLAQWIEQETPEGVTLIYPKNEVSAQIVEEVRQSLKPIETQLQNEFPFSLRGITLVLDPRPGSHNGLATVVPDRRVTIHMMPPYILGSIGENASWTYETTLHELTHIAHVDMNRGFMKALRTVFGPVISPNSTLSTWIIEGLAVVMESKYSTSGRVRSTFGTLILEEACREGLFGKSSFASLDQMSSRSQPWPLGMRPYIIGADFLRFVESRIGADALKNYHQKTSGIFPYFWVFFKVKPGLSWSTLWSEYTAWRNSTCKPIQKATLPFQNTKDGFLAWTPTLTTDGIYFHRRTTNDRGKVYFWDHQLEKPKELFKREALAESDFKRMAFDEKRKQLYYAVTGPVGWSDQERSHIFSYDFKKHRKVSKEQGFDPAILPESQTLAYVHISPEEGAGIRLQSLTKKETPPVWACPPRRDADFFQPVFVPSRRSLLATVHQRGQRFEIWECSLENKKWTRLLFDAKKGFHSPSLSPSGVLLTEMQDHEEPVTKIFQFSTRQLCQLPQIGSLIRFQPQGNRTMLAGLAYSNQGFDIARSPIGNDGLTPTGCSSISVAAESPADSSPTLVSQTRDYRPYRYLLPTFWVPTLYVSNSALLVGAATAMWDPVFRHQYILSVAYNSRPKRPEGVFQYTYQFHPKWTLTPAVFGFNDPVYFTQLFFQPLLSGTVSLGFPLHPFDKWRGQIGFLTEHRVRKGVLEPSRVNAIRAGVAFQDTTSTTAAPTWTGVRFSVTTDASHRWWGSENDFLRFRQTTQAQTPPLFFNSILAAKISSGYIHVLNTNPKPLAPGFGRFTAGGGDRWSSFVPTHFLMRGYPLGYFRTTQIHVGSLGYHIPISNIHRGIWLLPFFMKRVRAEIIADTLTGDFTNYKLWHKYFTSAGLEAHLDVELFYGVPAVITTGVYKGLNRGGEWQWRFFLDVPLI